MGRYGKGKGERGNGNEGAGRTRGGGGGYQREQIRKTYATRVDHQKQWSWSSSSLRILFATTIPKAKRVQRAQEQTKNRRSSQAHRQRELRPGSLKLAGSWGVFAQRLVRWSS